MGPGVLVVEDDPHVRVVLDELLQDQGLDVWSVGQEADRFKVLLTDINLGGGTNGFDVARRARSLNAGIIVIFITGNPIEPRRFNESDGVMMHKPLNLQALADMIRAATNIHH